VLSKGKGVFNGINHKSTGGGEGIVGKYQKYKLSGKSRELSMSLNNNSTFA
jgi:hypothetical protein